MSDLLQRIIAAYIKAIKQIRQFETWLVLIIPQLIRRLVLIIPQLIRTCLKAFQQVVKSEVWLVCSGLVSTVYLLLYVPFRLRRIIDAQNKQRTLQRGPPPLTLYFSADEEAKARTKAYYTKEFRQEIADYEHKIKQLKLKPNPSASEILNTFNYKLMIENIEGMIRLMEPEWSTPLSMDELDYLEDMDELNTLKAGVKASYEQTLRALESERSQYKRRVTSADQTLQALKRKFEQKLDEEFKYKAPTSELSERALNCKRLLQDIEAIKQRLSQLS